MRLPHALLAPAETIAVVCFGFEADRLRRQPWHVAHGLACGFTALGHHVRVLTDATALPTAQRYETETVAALFGRGGPHASLRAALARLAPSRIFLICGALRLARLGSLDLGAPVSLVMTSPRVHARELGPQPPILVAAPEPTALAAAITTCLADPEAAAARAIRARSLVEHEYGWERVVDRLEAIYGIRERLAA